MNHQIKTAMLGMITAIVLMPQGAHTAVIYDFAGTCSFGCTGTISGILTLADPYTPGSPIAETSDTGGIFVGFERYLNGVPELSIKSSDYAIVAGTTDPFFGAAVAGDGLLPAVSGVSSIADVYIVSRDGMIGLNDYTHSGGMFITRTVEGVNGTNLEGINGTWTLRAAVPAPQAVPLPAAVWLFASGLIGVVGIGLTRA